MYLAACMYATFIKFSSLEKVSTNPFCVEWVGVWGWAGVGGVAKQKLLLSKSKLWPKEDLPYPKSRLVVRSVVRSHIINFRIHFWIRINQVNQVKIFDHVSHTCAWNYRRIFISNKKCLYVCSDVIFDVDAMFDVFKHLKLILAMISSFMKHLRKDQRIITMRSCKLCTCGPLCSKTKTIEVNNRNTSV